MSRDHAFLPNASFFLPDTPKDAHSPNNTHFDSLSQTLGGNCFDTTVLLSKGAPASVVSHGIPT